MNFILDVVHVFILTNPERSGTDVWEVIIVYFNFSVWSEDVEVVTCCSSWSLGMNNFIKMIMNNLSEVNN
jgi:hypothetical protein